MTTISAIISSVIHNRSLMTYIFEYLDIYDLKRLNLLVHFRKNTYVDYIRPQHNTLLYGQVQSGKTSKIMEYIKTFKPDVLKVVIIQNNKHMLSQYKSALVNQQISFHAINSISSTYPYNHNSKVLITIYNKFRMRHLQDFMRRNAIQKYCLVLDESDQYLHKIKNSVLFQKSKDVLHVTATPFRYTKASDIKKYKSRFELDNVIKIQPPKEYMGIDKVDFIPIVMNSFDLNNNNAICGNIKNIIKTDFLQQDQGFMLINSFTFVANMKQAGLSLSTAYPNIPIMVLSSKCALYHKGKISNYHMKDVKSCIDKFNKVSHMIVIANRLSNRGINYTNTSYSRYITHQISMAGGSYTSFLQKCRIFGLRKESDYRGKVYCITSEEKQMLFIDKLKSKVAKLFNAPALPEPKPKKITVKELKVICRHHGVKGFSKCKRDELIQLLNDHEIPIERIQEQKQEQEQIEYKHMGTIVECPITCMPIKDAVRIGCGKHQHMFERNAIQHWFENHQTCPVCNEEVPNKKLYSVALM